MERSLPQYKAFLPENDEMNYRCINDLNHQNLRAFAKSREVNAFEIAESKVVRLQSGKKQVQQVRRVVRLAVNSIDELCYVLPFNNLKLVNRDSKPLYMNREALEEIEVAEVRNTTVTHMTDKYSGQSRYNVWAAIMDDGGARENEGEKTLEEVYLQVSFVVSKVGNNRNETINLYVEAITKEIEEAKRSARSSVERILCNGLVKSENFIMNGLRVKLEKLGYKMQLADLPEGHNGRSSYKRVLVEKSLK